MSGMSTPVRVRFAPSPTGFLHIGSIRSALFNFLYARRTGGVFVLRLEDTDRERFVPEAEAHLVESLRWLGIGPDEGVGGEDRGYGPYVQSERLHLYRDQAEVLLEKGALYRCWCSPERLTALREQATEEKRAFKYDRHCLGREGDPKEPHVLRFRIPDEPKVVAWDDAVRGRIEFAAADLDDFVAVKSDGFPTYQFANVVDDHLMEITHVLRADEWIPSTPKHILLYGAFGWEPPVFAHLPAVTAPGGGKKLSKRHGAKTALELREEGYLPEAIVNFLAFLGWNEGGGSTKEVYTLGELEHAFSLERIQRSPGVFDAERLLWLNGLHLRRLWHEDRAEFMRRADDFWPESAKASSHEYREAAMALVFDRLRTLPDIPELTDFFFAPPRPAAELLTQKLEPAAACEILAQLPEVLRDAEWTEAGLEEALRSYVSGRDLKAGAVFGLIRVAVTGRTTAPGLFETLAVLGRETTLTRLEVAADTLKSV